MLGRGDCENARIELRSQPVRFKPGKVRTVLSSVEFWRVLDQEIHKPLKEKQIFRSKDVKIKRMHSKKKKKKK